MPGLLGPSWWLPADAASKGQAFDRYLVLNLWIGFGLFALLHLLLWAALRLSRLSRRATSRAAAFEYVPVALLTLLFAAGTLRAQRLWAESRYTGADPGAMQVEATGAQFAWYFRYPGRDAAFGRTRPELVAPGEGNPLGIDPADDKGKDDFVSSELVIPAGREVDVRLHAQDVIHGFAVPELRLKQNAVPGQNFHVHFTAAQAGTYTVLCTQVCGLGHFRMAAKLRVVSESDYAKWLDSKENAQ